tara:strand:- start:11801 stop:13516 length:1716 start_codon:yes stop_codon:yes gene_type:complete
MKKSEKKEVISEMKQMSYLIGYDRGKTVFEQLNEMDDVSGETEMMGQEDDLNEIAPVVLVGGTLAAAGAADWIYDWWTDGGDMGGGEKYKLAMDRNTFAEIEKSMKNLGYKAGHDVWDGVDVISKNDADDAAETLYDAMDGPGTSDSKLQKVFLGLGSVLDLARISYEYGKKEGEDLEEWLDGDLSTADINTYVKAPLAKKPFVVYDRKQYDNGADFVAAVEAKIDKDMADELAANAPEEEETVSTEVDWTTVTMNGETLDFDYEMDAKTKNIYDQYVEKGYLKKYTPEFIFAYAYDKAHSEDGSDYYIEYPGDGKVVVAGEDLAEGHYGGNKGDESMSRRDYAEGGVGRKGGKRVKNIKYGEEDSGDVKSDTKTKPTPSKSARYTVEDIANGTAVAKKGDKGAVVKQLQTMLMNAGEALPKYGADGDYGNETVAAVKSYQKKNGNLDNGSGDIGKKTYDLLKTGKAKGEVKADVVTKADEAEVDKISIEKEKADKVTIDSQIDQLNKQIAQQPTKEKCKVLIATAAAGIKKGVRLNDRDSLAQCFNSYNFGLFGNSKKVRKAYNLKGKGN